jgi:hypothetical protein
MSWQKYEDQCPGCTPVLADPVTLEPLPQDDPMTKAVMEVWAGTTLEERQAFHRFTCLNSRAADDLVIINELTRRIQAAVRGRAS